MPRPDRSPRVKVTPVTSVAPDGQGRLGWRLRVLVLLFAASGCSALIYEIVWFQWLELVIGSSAVSLGVLLAVFMGGMSIGSILLPRLLPTRIPPLRVYGALELGIAATAALIWLELPAVRAVYSGLGGPGPIGLVSRAAIAAVCLLPPTMMMGAALPVVARAIKSTPEGLSWLGVLYVSNTVGAVVGCLGAGFYLLRVHDMVSTTLVAVGLNVLAGVASLLIAPRAATRPAPAPSALESPQPRDKFDFGVHMVVLLSGFCALGGEVVWTRLLALLLGSTVYTFSIILSVILIGIALGAAVGSLLVRLSSRSRRNLGMAQLLLLLSIYWAGYLINGSLPYWPIAPALSPSPWTTFQLDLLRCIWTLLPATLTWGATIPLALAAAGTGKRADRTTASIYAANTFGAILGALSFTFVLIPLGGTDTAQQAMLWLSLGAALLALYPLIQQPLLSPRAIGHLLLFLLAGFGTIALAQHLPRLNGELIAFGRSLAYRRGLQDPRTGQRVPLPRVLYVGEGLNESVAVTTDDHVTLFHVSGKIEASTATKDMRLQRMLGCVPALLHRNPRSVLVVGFGAGVTAGTFLTYPSVERVVICELEPLIPQHVARFFSDANNGVATDPRVTIVYDDARHYMLTSKERFDVITSDPIHPWVKGSAVLYSREYFELVRRRLNPGGLVSQWVPLYQSSEATIKEELATFILAFPGASVWANRDAGQGYDLVMLGSAQPQVIDLDGLDARWHGSAFVAARSALATVGFADWSDLLATYAGRDPDLRPWLAGASINEDRSLHLQFEAGLESLVEQEADIYAHLTQYRSFPATLFVGSRHNVDAVMLKGGQ